MFVIACQYHCQNYHSISQELRQLNTREDNSHFVFQEQNDIPLMQDFLVNTVMCTKRPLPATLRQRRNLLHVSDESPAGPSISRIDTSGKITQQNESLPQKDYKILSQTPSGDSNSTIKSITNVNILQQNYLQTTRQRLISTKTRIKIRRVNAANEMINKLLAPWCYKRRPI